MASAVAMPQSRRVLTLANDLARNTVTTVVHDEHGYDALVTALSHPPTVPYIAGEKAMLEAFLDAMRLAVMRKLDGVTEEEARSTPTVSSQSLLGIVKHLAWTERRWFHESLGDSPIEDPKLWGDGTEEFSVGAETKASLVGYYHQQCAKSRALTASVSSLDHVIVSERFGNRVSLRWIMIHMIEETARHAGHADIIRESIDGRLGD